MENHGFLQQALVYLMAGVIAVPLFRRLGLGSVLGYLIAGVVIGPWGLRLISHPQTVLQFSEFGVVLLLFLIGLELERAARVGAAPRDLRHRRACRSLATIAAVTAIARSPSDSRSPWRWSPAWASRCPRPPSGSPRCRRRTCCSTPGGQASFAVLLFQDLAVIPLLLVIGSARPAKRRASTGESWRRRVGLIALLIAARPLPRAPGAALSSRRRACARCSSASRCWW